MEKLVSELLRFEIDENKHTFNGFSSSDEYTAYLNELYRNTTLSGLENEIYRNGILGKLQELELRLNISLPNRGDVDAIESDYSHNPVLKRDVEWYRMLLYVRGIKEYYAQKILEILNPNTESVGIEVHPCIEKQEKHPHIEEVVENPSIEETPNEWMTYEEMLEEYNFTGKTMVKDAKWRENHKFYPCKQDGKGYALRISRTLLNKWLNGEKE